MCASLTSCGADPKRQKLDQNFGSGHNGVLWGETREDAVGWIKLNKRLQVQVVEQTDEALLKKSHEIRQKYLNDLDIRSIPNIDDSMVAYYYDGGLQYAMSFDDKNRFAAVTFGPMNPGPPLSKEDALKVTLQKFREKKLDPLIEKYGKPREKIQKDAYMEKRFWVWKGEKVIYILEFIYIFPSHTEKIPAHWQYSESIILSNPKHFR